ncbi:hypothetical protein DL96DRAFT_1628119 [Flagelloscypha sp. PMI_526]|nr:hypothetical protein DL96DRAFT_1628119 [Flagelloscypha sp. PMI_526]
MTTWFGTTTTRFATTTTWFATTTTLTVTPRTATNHNFRNNECRLNDFKDFNKENHIIDQAGDCPLQQKNSLSIIIFSPDPQCTTFNSAHPFYNLNVDFKRHWMRLL